MAEPIDTGSTQESDGTLAVQDDAPESDNSESDIEGNTEQDEAPDLANDAVSATLDLR